MIFTLLSSKCEPKRAPTNLVCVQINTGDWGDDHHFTEDFLTDGNRIRYTACTSDPLLDVANGDWFLGL